MLTSSRGYTVGWRGDVHQVPSQPPSCRSSPRPAMAGRKVASMRWTNRTQNGARWEIFTMRHLLLIYIFIFFLFQITRLTSPQRGLERRRPTPSENPGSNLKLSYRTLDKLVLSTLLQFTRLCERVPGYRHWWIFVYA